MTITKRVHQNFGSTNNVDSEGMSKNAGCFYKDPESILCTHAGGSQGPPAPASRDPVPSSGLCED